MNQLLHCFDNAASYPQAPSLIHHKTYDHVLKALKHRLDEREDDLCCTEDVADVNILHCKTAGRSFVPHCVKTYNELLNYFNFKPGQLQPDEDPQSQFIFLHAFSSRDQLQVTRRMLTSLLTYYQVMPSFMEFIFPFGRTADARDFLFNGFRQETRLADQEKALQVNEICRSGRRLQVCYGLRSPSKTQAFKGWPWSVQQTAIYHSFDVENGRMTWILVKGDPEVKNRIASTINSLNHKHLSKFETRDVSFSTALATHQLLSDWAGENWRWYIKFLEEEVQRTTDRALNVTINRDSVAASLPAVANMDRTTPTQSKNAQAWGLGIRRALTWKPSQTAIPPEVQPVSSLTGRKLPPTLPPGAVKPHQRRQSANEFDIDDIRMIERVEERTNEALLILKTQISVLNNLLKYYKNILESEDFPQEMSKQCKSNISRFEVSISGAISDLELLYSRVETLSHLLADRKTLMSNIIEYQSMQASTWLGVKAQESSRKMEDMTYRMEVIAQQTQKETVSMKVITVITLIFLPGTFVSTLMSTDIVKFQNDAAEPRYKVYSPKALYLFLEITFALMATTILVWVATNHGINWWQKRQRARDEQKRLKEEKLVSV